jgi:phospholipase/carboxylesterase
MPQTDLFWSYRYEEGFYNSEVQPQRQPLRTFLPTGYEPNYPYPLIVFFHGHGSSEEQVLRLAPKLSRRNYICISLRGTQQLDPTAEGRPGYSWGQAGDLDPQIEDYVYSAIQQTRRNYHVHSERIYLAGVCEGAALAYRLGLMYPERIAGIIALNGTMPRHGNPLLRLPEARQLRVLIGHGLANSVVPLSMARSDFRLLYSAGLQVTMHSYPATHRLHTDMLRDINRWVMAAIHEEQHGPEEPEEEE